MMAYLYHPMVLGVVLLVVAYAKNEQDDISDASKRLFKAMLQEAKKELDRRRSV